MLTRFRRWAVAVLLVGAGMAVQAQQSMVTYVGDAGRDRFLGSLRLSDGTVLVAGRSQNLSWVPGTVPVTTLTIPQVPSAVNDSVLGINSRDTTGSIAYVVRMSADLGTVLNVVRFPSGTVLDVSKIKTNSIPGAPTGDIYISGRRIFPRQRNGATTGNSNFEGYYIAKLNSNFLNGTPTGCEWTHDLRAQFIRNNTSAYPYYGAGSDAGILNNQPWDVTADGKVYAVLGREFSDDWCQLVNLKPLTVGGLTRLVEDTGSMYPYHQIRIGSSDPAINGRNIEYRNRNVHVGDSINVTISGTPYRVRVDSMRGSGIILKMNRGGSNQRSYDINDYNLLTNDENGNPGRKGKYPDDIYYAEPCANGCPNNGPGYTGYSYAANGNNTTTQRVVSISVDKRTGEIYYGSSTWSNHRYSNPPQDFESAIVSLLPNGDIKWWARGYKEDTAGSKALQFIDQVEVDYTNNQLVVLARSVGDDTHNFWHGNAIAASPGANGFQNKITGPVADRATADVRWIGKYRLSDGVIVRSTYVGEVKKDAVVGAASTDPLLDGWHDPNNGDPALATTKITKMSVAADGSILVVGVSEGRTITTSNAYQKMLKANPNAPSEPGINTFVRVYRPDLSGISYSTLLTNVWDPITGAGGGSVELTDVMFGPTTDFVQVVGYHRAATSPLGVSDGGPVPTNNVPSWGTARPLNDAAIIASLFTNCAGTLPAAPDSISGPRSGCANQVGRYIVSPVPGATHYVWALPGTNYSGYSTTDTIFISGAAGNGGTLRVVAVNACGAGQAATLVLGRPTTTGRPTNLSLLPAAGTSPTAHCANTTRWYRVAAVPGATSYRWYTNNTGWVPVGGLPTDTVFVSSADSIQIFVADTTTRAATLRVRADGLCGPGLPFARTIQIARSPVLAPDSIRRPNGSTDYVCAGTARTYTAGTVTGATGYVWTLPGANWTAANLTTTTPSLSVTATPGPGGVMTVAASNACGAGPAKQLLVPAVAQTPINYSINLNGQTLSVTRQPYATYQWQRNNNNIPGATDTTYTANNSQSGTYTVRVTVCGQTVTLGPITSLSEKLSAGSIDLFPNPTTGKLTLKANVSSTADVSVRVLDAMGRSLGKSGRVMFADQQDQVELDLSDYASGLYIVEITRGNERVIKRVNKQ